MTDQQLEGKRWWIRSHQGNGSRHRPRPSQPVLPMKNSPTYQSFEPPDDQWATDICKKDQGAARCRYLAISSNGGWSCEKHTHFAAFIDRKVDAGEVIARGDNCPGRGEQ